MIETRFRNNLENKPKVVEMIEWSDALSSGLENIDMQHQEVVRRFNEFSAAVKQGHTKEHTNEILTYMCKFVAHHFESEEDLMHQIDHELASRQTIEHAEFIGKLFKLNAKFESGGPDVADEILGLLETWIMEHICAEDKLFAKYSEEIQGQDPATQRKPR